MRKIYKIAYMSEHSFFVEIDEHFNAITMESDLVVNIVENGKIVGDHFFKRNSTSLEISEGLMDTGMLLKYGGLDENSEAEGDLFLQASYIIPCG